MQARTVLLLIALAFGATRAGAQESGEFAGRWEATLSTGSSNLRLVLDIDETSDGIYLGTLTSVDQGNVVIPIDVIEVDGDAVALEVRAVRGRFTGNFNDDRSRIGGTWSQGAPLPLEFRKTSTAAAASRPQTAAPSDEPPSPQTAGAADPFGAPPVEVQVPFAPTVFASGGRTYLAYELHLTNFAPTDVSLRRIEVLDAAGSAQPLTAFEGAQLNTLLQPVGVQGAAGAHDLRTIAPGRRVIAFIWIDVDGPAQVPAMLRHRIATSGSMIEGGVTGTVATDLRVLGSPLKGANWMAANGPGNDSGHRRALMLIDGEARIAQRYAIDWVQLGADGRTFTGDQADNAVYHAYGEEVLAVADGTIAAVKDGIPENVPGVNSRAVPITLDTVGGNSVALDIGANQFATYGHLQPGSLRVKVGDRVSKGQVLGLLGNSGNSTEPHLHFHVANGAQVLAAEGMPYVLDHYSAVNADGTTQTRSRELPLQNAVVNF